MIFQSKPQNEPQNSAFSLHINLSEDTTRWLFFSLIAITIGSGVVWVIQPTTNSTPTPTPSQALTESQKTHSSQ